MHLSGCMRCGEDVDDLYRARNPAWVDWDLCEQCVREIDAEYEAEQAKCKQAGEQQSTPS